MKEDLIKLLNSEKIWTNEIIERATAMLENAPPGDLRVFKHYSNQQYYQKLPGKRIYISKKRPELAISLAQKEYDMAVLTKALAFQEQVDAMWNTLEVDFDEIINTFSEEKKKLIKPYFTSADEFIKQWEGMSYEGKLIDESTPELFSNRGERVRSKSEKIIADKLAEMGIPYRYEAPLFLGTMGIVYPDFTLLKVCTREEIYWEHLGMMDDPDYVHKALNKINTYIRNGYIPGKNLLLTYESRAIPLNMRNAEAQLRAILDL